MQCAKVCLKKYEKLNKQNRLQRNFLSTSIFNSQQLSERTFTATKKFYSHWHTNVPCLWVYTDIASCYWWWKYIFHNRAAVIIATEYLNSQKIDCSVLTGLNNVLMCFEAHIVYNCQHYLAIVEWGCVRYMKFAVFNQNGRLRLHDNASCGLDHASYHGKIKFNDCFSIQNI